MVVTKRWLDFWKDTKGYAVVEATILFPIILMSFAGLVLLSMYLPTRSVLQRETQYAATVLATTQSDTWLDFDKGDMNYYWRDNNNPPSNVYAALLSAFFKGSGGDAENIVENMETNNLTGSTGELTVQCQVNNYVIYKELVVTATRTIPIPVNLEIIRFPKEIPITVSSTAVVQNGDEFVRNIDLAADFVEYLDKEYGLGIDKLAQWVNQAWKFLGI